MSTQSFLLGQILLILKYSLVQEKKIIKILNVNNICVCYYFVES